jgi:hypothetical protein
LFHIAYSPVPAVICFLKTGLIQRLIRGANVLAPPHLGGVETVEEDLMKRIGLQLREIEHHNNDVLTPSHLPLVREKPGLAHTNPFCAVADLLSFFVVMLWSQNRGLVGVTHVLKPENGVDKIAFRYRPRGWITFV